MRCAHNFPLSRHITSKSAGGSAMQLLARHLQMKAKLTGLLVGSHNTFRPHLTSETTSL
jgi:hypothetical protein